MSVPAPSSPARPSREDPRRWAVPLAALAVLLVLATLAWQVWVARPPLTGDAEWIWAELPERLPSPAAFYLVRDFRVPPGLADPGLAGPGSGDPGSGDPGSRDPEPPAVRLLVQGDEEYVLHLNGRRLGSNRYRPGAPLDLYRLDGLLLPGVNRLVVELRSSRGAGGFLAALDAGSGEPVLVSDRSWRVVRRYVPGLVEGWLPLPELASAGGDDGTGDEGEPPDRAPFTAERPISWGRPPVGRWGRPETGEARPALAAVGELCPAAPVLGPGGGTGGGAGTAAPPPAGGPAAVRALFDFGRRVTGYLVVEHPPTAPSAPPQVSLFALGDRPLVLLPADSGNPPPEEPTAEVAAGDALPLVTLPGRAVWTDVVPRTFRYAAVAGLRPPLSVAVLEVDPDAVGALPGAIRSEAAEPGLAGLPPRPRRTPAEDRVRRRLADGAGEGGGG